MNSHVKHLIKMILILIVGMAIGAGLVWKMNNPSDFRHPRDRDIKLY